MSNTLLYNNKKIKLYFDGLIPNHIYPLLEEIDFELTTFENSDFLISCKFYAENTYSTKIIQDNLSSYQKIMKKVIVFLICDFADNFYIPNNVLLFRTSIYKSHKKFNEFLLPYVLEEIDRPFTILNKTKLPIIGFCGRVDNHRKKLIEKLQNTPKVKLNFNLKTEFWGGNPHNKDLINEFTNNIINSHFTVCNRGNGNYSMRFYQVLSAGRIPILVDTDSILPFNDKINWNEIIIIGKNEDDVINKLFEWWKEKDIEELQKKCKNIYDTFFDKRFFLKNIFEGFYDINNSNNNFSFPIDFDFNIYSKYNDLGNMDASSLIKHYSENGMNENRIYKLPDNFNINYYRINNRDIVNFNYDEIITHYVNFGYQEGRKYNK